jgi:hypothetical protein
MKKVLVAFGAVAVGVLLFPEDASAQRRGFGVGMGRSYGGGPALRGRVVAVQPGLGRAYYGTARYRPVLAHGYRGIGYPGRRWGYGGYRPYYGGRRFIGYGGAVAAGLIGGLALGSSVGFYGAPYDPGYSYEYPSYAEPYYGEVAYEAYPPGLVQPCSAGPGCRADGYPDARWYRRAYGY